MLGLNLTGINGVEVRNANHIFNAIHSSMRQFGSSLNHNGMTAFIATVPEGTHLYHGTGLSERVNGTEWLAFEPEHALAFARPQRKPPGPSDNNEGRHGEIRLKQETSRRERSSQRPRKNRTPAPDSFHSNEAEPRHANEQKQNPMSLESNDRAGSDDEAHGYLHTYRAKHDLRLLYLDGQSAAKSDKGTLDLQDYVLLHSSPPDQGLEAHPKSEDISYNDRHPGGPMGEADRALKLCAIAQNEWEGRIDGILRMELGFEIILCSFAKDLNIDRITIAEGDRAWERPSSDLSYYQAVASRFDGIGGQRVRLNYQRFITLFENADAVYFDDKGFPRVRNDTHVVRPILADVKGMVLQAGPADGRDWQSVSDEVVSRYGDRIEYLASGDIGTLNAFKTEVNNALRPFIDYGIRNSSAEIERCATQYFASLPDSNILAARTILNVTTVLCSALHDAGESKTLDEGIAILRELKSWLAWTTWKRCRGCDCHEVCFVPIWPLGGQDEFDHPRCISDMANVSRGYWGDMRPPGRREPPM